MEKEHESDGRCNIYCTSPKFTTSKSDRYKQILRAFELIVELMELPL
jgi:hypothetical protein